MGTYIVGTGGKDAYIQGFGDWTNEYPWQKFLTLTFAYHGVSVKRAKQLFEDFVVTLGKNIYYVVVFEHFRLADTVHIHALIYGVTERIMWIHGTAKVYEYVAAKGARFYIAKHLKSGKAEWDCRLPPRKSDEPNNHGG